MLQLLALFIGHQKSEGPVISSGVKNFPRQISYHVNQGVPQTPGEFEQWLFLGHFTL